MDTRYTPHQPMTYDATRPMAVRMVTAIEQHGMAAAESAALTAATAAAGQAANIAWAAAMWTFAR